MAKPRDRFRRYLATLNERDLARARALFADHVLFEDSAWPTVMHGPDQVCEMLASRWRAFPDLSFELREGPYPSADGDTVAVKLRLTGTMTGPLEPPGFDPSNRRIRMDVAAFYDFEGEQVSRGRVILDTALLGRQIGALPGPGSVGEELAVVWQRLSAWRIRTLGW